MRIRLLPSISLSNSGKCETGKAILGPAGRGFEVADSARALGIAGVEKGSDELIGPAGAGTCAGASTNSTERRVLTDRLDPMAVVV